MRTTGPYKWCAVDAEGDVGDKGLLGVAFYCDEYAAYLQDHTAITMALYDLARNGYTFLCHNASYDIPVIWQQLGLNPEVTIFNGRLHHGSWKYDLRKKAAQIWDTLDLSGGISLRELGNAMGYPKYNTPHLLLGIDPDRYGWQCEKHNRWECIECYATRDAEIAYRFMEGLSNTLAGWSVYPSPRIAGISMDVWKALDNPEPIGLTDKRIEKLARRSYYGGRVETYQLGYIQPVYTADVTSMYPSVMAETAFPEPHSMIYMDDPGITHIPNGTEGVAVADITVPIMHVPPLPYTHKGDRLYPIGRIIGTYTFLELRYAVSLGCRINKLHSIAYTSTVLHPFNQFVGVLWQLRESYINSSDPRSLFAKLLMNNLYGRLGARENPEREIIRKLPPNYDSLKERRNVAYEFIGEDGYYIQFDTLDFGREWTNVLWAAYITSAARVKLHKLMVLQGEGLIYCDTDSIFATVPIQGTDKGLGQLKPTGDFKCAIIAQPKMYALQDFNGEWQPKAKGVPRQVALSYLHGNDVTFTKPVKPKESLSRHIAAGTWIPITKHRHPVPHRRHPRHPEQLFTEYGSTITDPQMMGPIR